MTNRIELDKARLLEVERLAAYEMSNSILWMQVRLQRAFDLRPEACEVYLVILLATVQRFVRSQPTDPTFLTRAVLPLELSGSISRRRIAEALNIPLETVRRHVDAQKQRGIVIEISRGKLSTPGGTLARLAEDETSLHVAQRFLGLSNALLRLGVFTLPPQPAPRKPARTPKPRPVKV